LKVISIPYFIELKKVDEKILPRDKVKVFLSVFEMATTHLAIYSNKAITLSADNVTPFIIYITLKASLQKLYSIIKYL